MPDAEWTAAVARAQAQVALAQQAWRRGDFPAAALAAGAAARIIDAIGTDHPADIPFPIRLAPIYAGQALIEIDDLAQAAAVIAAGIPFVPEMVAADDMDLAGMYADPARFPLAVAKIAGAVARDPGNADLHFLLGYLHRFSRQPGEAARELERALAIDPRHAGARALTRPAQVGIADPAKAGET